MAAAAGGLLPFGALISIVLLGTFTVSATFAFLGLWLSRRRRLALAEASKQGGCRDLTGETTIASTVQINNNGLVNEEECNGSPTKRRSPRKLQKLPSTVWAASRFNSTTSLLPKAVPKVKGQKGKAAVRRDDDGVVGDGGHGEHGEPEVGGAVSVSMLPGMSWMSGANGGVQRQGSMLPFNRLRKTSSGSLLRLHKAKLGLSRQKSSASERRMANSAWIDEEALHGPEVSGLSNITDESDNGNGNGNNGDRKSWLFGWRQGKGRDWIRESWPLRTRTPTVPRLAGDYQELAGSQSHQSQIQAQTQASEQRVAEQLETETMTGRLGIPSTDSGRRAIRSAYGAMEGMLPDPPQSAVVRGQVGTGGGGGFVVQHRHTKSEPQQRILRITNPNPSPTNSPSRPIPIPRTQSTSVNNRQVSTESTLSQILRSTEKRLQEGGASGVSRRNRATIAAASGPQRGLSLHMAKRLDESRDPALRRSESLRETRSTRPEHDIPVISPSSSGLVAPLTLVPKPSMGQEQRPDSRESLSSDPDSLLAEPAYSETPSGLTSPSRVSSIAGAPSVAEADIEMLLMSVNVPSNRSSMTSAASLSTIHSEDESSEEGARVSAGTKTPSSDRADMVAGAGRPVVTLQTSSMANNERFTLPAPLSAVDASAPSLPCGSSARPFTSYGCPVPRPLSTRSQGEVENNRKSFVRKSIIAQEPIGPMPSMPTRLLPCPGVPSGKNCVIAQTSCGTWHAAMADPFQIPVSPTSLQTSSTDSASPTSSFGSAISRETPRGGLRSPPNKSSTTYNNTLLNSIVLPPPTQHRYVDAKTVVGVTSQPPVRPPVAVAQTPERERRWPFINTTCTGLQEDGDSYQPPSPTPRSGGSRLSRQLSIRQQHQQQEERKASESSSIYSQDMIAANEAFSPAPVPTFTIPFGVPSSPTRTSLPPSPTTVGLAAAQALNAANFQRNSILFAGAQQQQTPSRRGSRTAIANKVSVLRDADDVEDDSNKENEAVTSTTPKASPIAATIAQLRRMNSVLSTASSVSSINTEVADAANGSSNNLSRRNSRAAAAAVSASPTQSALRGGGFNPNPRRDSHLSYGHRRSGSRNYLFALSGGVTSTPSTPKVLKRAGTSASGSKSSSGGGVIRPISTQVTNSHSHSRTGSIPRSGSAVGRVVSISRSGSPQRITLTPAHAHHHRSQGAYQHGGGSSMLGSPSPINVNILKNRFQFDDDDDHDNKNSNVNGITAQKQGGSGVSLKGKKKDEDEKEEDGKRNKLPVRFALQNSSPQVSIGVTPSSPSPNSKTGMAYVTPKGKRWRQSNESLGLYDRDGFLINSPGRPSVASLGSVRA